MPVSADAAELRSAPARLVPRSLAEGGGKASAVRPLIATAGVVHGSPRAAAARTLVAQLPQLVGTCFDAVKKGEVGAGPFAEDGELYPCEAGGTATEGSDIDAIEVLHAP